MVAMAIFVISIGVLLSAQTAATRNQEEARNVYVATNLLRVLLTTAETEGITAEGDEETKGDFGEEFPGFKWTRKVTDAAPSLLSNLASFGGSLASSEAIMEAAAPIVSGIRMVTFEVSWGSEEKPGAAQLVYYQAAGE